jgi:hypothetical protein
MLSDSERAYASEEESKHPENAGITMLQQGVLPKLRALASSGRDLAENWQTEMRLRGESMGRTP